MIDSFLGSKNDQIMVVSHFFLEHEVALALFRVSYFMARDYGLVIL